MADTETKSPLTVEGKTKNRGQVPGRGRARRRAVRTGLYGEEVLGLLFRLGGSTATGISELLGIPYHTVNRTLRKLYSSSPRLVSLVSVPPLVKRDGRWEDFYYLSGAGVGYAAHVVGIDSEAFAGTCYRRARQPGRARHADPRNLFLRRLYTGAPGTGAYVALESMYSETHPSFPLVVGEKEDDGRAKRGAGSSGAGPAYELVEPDGVFDVGWDEGLSSRFFVELERKYQPAVVRDKIDRYAALYARLADERMRDVKRKRAEGRIFYTSELVRGTTESFTGVCPVVFVFLASRAAERMRDSIRLSAEERDEELARYLSWRESYKGAGGAFLFCGLDEVCKEGAYARILKPLRQYPEARGGWTVGLEDAARMVARDA